MCGFEFGALNAIHEEMGDEVQVVAVAVHSPEADVIAMRDEEELIYPIFATTQDVATDWNVVQYPTTYVLDSTGRIVARDTGYTPGWELQRRARKALPGR